MTSSERGSERSTERASVALVVGGHGMGMLTRFVGPVSGKTVITKAAFLLCKQNIVTLVTKGC